MTINLGTYTFKVEEGAVLDFLRLSSEIAELLYLNKETADIIAVAAVLLREVEIDEESFYRKLSPHRNEKPLQLVMPTYD